ncbi:MAG: DNA polymerase III subunit epsilon [Bifidobacteriaceae bacterium]|jgi:DNA polymerase-3 subunit epsilon|nr:DNA polymerase III subunit epsilon [Bifidobacteriaceae bacterium]
MISPAWPVLGFDTETTGVAVAHDRIVTAALVWRDADATVRERTWLVRPDIDIPARATAIHGITTEHARTHGQDRATALEEIAAAIAADGDRPLVAFNAPFDLGILEAELRRTGLATLAERLGRPIGPVLDPLVIDRGIWRFRRGKRTLVAVADAYGASTVGEFHDALGDVHATIATLDAMLASSQAAEAAVHTMTPTELHAWQVTAHRQWAEEFNTWLRSQGRTPDASTTWP